ncbi:MAG: hypothetical protein JJT89_00795 [Nitriliruptoraceae bacterium]|nr:hypothetical protein [Nitriliruptoraceae bacterium]
MFELPTHHVRRERLLAGLDTVPVVVIEAPSGFGKSTLAVELRSSLGPTRVAQVTVHGDGGGDRRVLHPLRRALIGLGEDAAAAALAEPGDGAAEALQAALEVLDGTAPLLLVVDDAHLLGDDGALLVQVVEHRPTPLRLVIAARRLPSGAARLRTRPDVRLLGPEQLRFDVDDVTRLIEDGFGLEATTLDADRLLAATEGWPAALTFVVAQAARRLEGPDAVASTNGAAPGTRATSAAPARRLPVDAASRFSDQVASALPAELRLLAANLAHLPWMDEELANVVQRTMGRATQAPSAASPGDAEPLVDGLLRAGLPITTDTQGRSHFPGAIADVLRRVAPMRVEVARAIAGCHLDRDRPEEAIAILRSAGALEDLGRLFSALPTGARAHLTADEIIAAIDVLPRRVVDRYPRVLLELARAYSRAGEPDDHAAVLGRLRTLLDAEERTAAADGRAPSDPVLRRALEVEQLAMDVYSQPRDEVAARIDAALRAADDAESGTVARALVVRGMLHAWQGDRGVARRSLRRAAQLFRACGEPHEASRALVQLGFNVDLHGDLARAEETFAAAVSLAEQDGRARATALTYLGEVKVWLGRPQEGSADLEQALELARAVRDARARA